LCGSFYSYLEAGRHPKDDPNITAFIEALRTALLADGRPVRFLAGVDFSHVGGRFGDTWELSDANLAALEASDRKVIDAALTGDADEWFETIATMRDSTHICGFSSVYFMLRALRPGPGRLLRYEQSPEEESQSVVTYASIDYPTGAGVRAPVAEAATVRAAFTWGRLASYVKIEHTLFSLPSWFRVRCWRRAAGRTPRACWSPDCGGRRPGRGHEPQPDRGPGDRRAKPAHRDARAALGQLGTSHAWLVTAAGAAVYLAGAAGWGGCACCSRRSRCWSSWAIRTSSASRRWRISGWPGALPGAARAFLAIA